MTVAKRLVLQALCLIGLAGSVGAHAETGAKFDTPYTGSASVELRAEQTDTWLEIYEVTPAEVSSAIAALERMELPPKPVAVAFSDAFFARRNQQEVQLPARSFTLTRKGLPLSYGQNCMSTPSRGDLLTAEYRIPNGRTRVQLSASLLERFAFEEVERIGQEPLLTRMPEVSAQSCAQMKQDRVLFQGTLTLQTATKQRTTIPVLVQLIRMSP